MHGDPRNEREFGLGRVWEFSVGGLGTRGLGV